MNLKRSLLSIIAVLAVGQLAAQDRLYTKDGSMEEVKIREVGPRTITYKRWNNQEGPDFVIPKNEVERIKFQNGDEERFDRRGEMRPATGRNKRVSNVKYGKNIIAFAPIAMNNTSATGVGLSYERVLDKNYIVSFIIPATYSFRSETQYDYMNNIQGNRDAQMFWISPGIKFYPAGSNHKVTYSVGPNIIFATGNEPVYTQVNNNGIFMNQYVDRDIFMMGLMVTNYLNIQPTPRLYLGLQLGLGIPYITEDNGTYNNYSETKYYNKNSMIPLVDFEFKIGFRF